MTQANQSAARPPAIHAAGDDTSRFARATAFARSGITVETLLWIVLLAAAVVNSSGSNSNSVTRLYACNLAGAILGTLAAGFVLLPALGVRTTIAFAAVLNVVVGVIAIMLQRRAGAVAFDDVVEVCRAALDAYGRVLHI